MYITDLLGKKKEVTDLDKAIDQAECFANINPGESDFFVDKEKNIRLSDYWKDVYQKLLNLKNNGTTV